MRLATKLKGEDSWYIYNYKGDWLMAEENEFESLGVIYFPNEHAERIFEGFKAQVNR